MEELAYKVKSSFSAIWLCRNHRPHWNFLFHVVAIYNFGALFTIVLALVLNSRRSVMFNLLSFSQVQFSSLSEQDVFSLPQETVTKDMQH